MFQKFSKRVKSVWARLALLSAEMIIVLILFIAAITVFVVLVRSVIVLEHTAIDQKVFYFLHGHDTPAKNAIVQAVTFFGSHSFLIPANILLIAYFLFIRKERWYSIKIPAIALSSLGLMFTLKNLFQRKRPDIPLLGEAGGLSFPSGHALFSVTFYGLLIYIIWNTTFSKIWKWILICLLVLIIICIGFTRIYLRVHYTTDVIAGFCVGFIWLVIAVNVLNRLEKFSRQKLDPHVVE